VWISWYFSGGTADDRGLYETVGHQGTKTINGVTGSTIAAMYEHGTSGTVLAGGKLGILLSLLHRVSLSDSFASFAPFLARTIRSCVDTYALY